MNAAMLDFFSGNYDRGCIGMIGAHDTIGTLVREGQRGLTGNMEPSNWSHVFILGERRSCSNALHPGEDIFIYESDLDVDLRNARVLNGAQESRLIKWASDSHDVRHACVINYHVPAGDTDTLISKARTFAYEGEEHLMYPVLELLGTLWAVLASKLFHKNIFDSKNAVQCCTFAWECYQAIGKTIIGTGVDSSNITDEHIYQYARTSNSIVAEWHK